MGGADRWLPHWVIRQYHREDDPEKKELLTLGVIPYDPIDERIEEPLCLASRMRCKTHGDELYWLPQQQLRCKNGIGPLGEVRRIRREDLIPKPNRLGRFDETVEGGELLSIAVPLVSLVDEQAVMAKVIEPLLAVEYSTV